MTDRQRAFLAAYLGESRRNATHAATTAGYAWPDKQGARLTTFPEIAAVIRAANERRRQEWDAASKQRLAERRAEERKKRRRELRKWHAENPWYRAGTSPPPLPKSVIRRRAKLWAQLDAVRARHRPSQRGPPRGRVACRNVQ